ncbi:DUF4406 domain-containing protein [Desulfosporosinus lacus]|uniref:DUF7768 domain-containing protein n=1 Tax=Desulfosporosinus lacus DSM 15449 TaxID=1121420 RepID=A0A1M5V1G4_9FIRM|nr:DUF4406 domain-containing protein [Desulfosporosinus lacus]SHH69059.1 hypothetical protein SAMN02746098_01158 [Desulfosporosinus lacus DSM 15449]
MKLIYICSPLRGDMEANLKRASQYCAYAASCGVIPIAPHVAWNGVFDDTIPAKREAALRLGLELLKRCDEVWVMGNEITQGMQGEIDEAARLHRATVYVLDEQVEQDLKIRQEHTPLALEDCILDSNRQDYEGKTLVLDAQCLITNCRKSENSLWVAYNGFGCTYGARGQAVYAKSLFDGHEAHWERADFLGIVKPESLEKWLRQNPIRHEMAYEVAQEAKQEHSLEPSAKGDLGWPYVNGYCHGENTRLVPTAENLAAYIATKGLEGDLTITNPLDQPFLTTYGTFIDRCSDFAFLEQQLKPVLIPLQTGEIEPPPIQEYSGPYELADDEEELDGELEP